MNNELHTMYDDEGLCDGMLTMLKSVQVVGVESCKLIGLIADGITLLRNRLKEQKETGEHGQNHPAEWQEI